MAISLVLLVFALVLFTIAGAINQPDPWRGKLLCFGLACMAAAFVFEKAGALLAR